MQQSVTSFGPDYVSRDNRDLKHQFSGNELGEAKTDYEKPKARQQQVRMLSQKKNGRLIAIELHDKTKQKYP